MSIATATASLLRHPHILQLSNMLLSRDVRAKFHLSRCQAQTAIRHARERVNKGETP